MRRILKGFLETAWWGFLLAVLVVGAVAIAGLSTWVTVHRAFEESEVVVPDVVGLDLAEARDALAMVDLELTVEARRPHETVEAGRVFFQDPLAGAGGRRGRAVRVVVSVGQGSIRVPDLAGQSPRGAVLGLRQLGLELGDVVRVHDERTRAGRIMAQDPLPDTAVAERTPVHVLQSLGPRPRVFVMPDLRGHPLARVEVALASAGLRVASVRQQVVAGRPAGFVHAQQPAPGSPVRSEDEIDLVVTHQVERAVRELRDRPRFFTE